MMYSTDDGDGEFRSGGGDPRNETTFAALKLQRKQRLESMIEKRKNNFHYLMEIHQGEGYWLNSVLINHRELHSHISDKASRAVMYYYFGLSLSKILELPAGPATIKAMVQLLEEWEYMFASSTMQSMKYVLARQSNFIYPNFMPDSLNGGGGSTGGNGPTTGTGATGNSNGGVGSISSGPSGANSAPISEMDHQIRSGIYKFNNDIVYEYLQAPHIPFELNYIEVFYSMCQMLHSLYDKFWHEDSFRYN
jgi:hypothetical protein